MTTDSKNSHFCEFWSHLSGMWPFHNWINRTLIHLWNSHIPQMTFNPQKCEFLRITNKKNPTTILRTVLLIMYIYPIPNTWVLWLIINHPGTRDIQRIVNKATQTNAFLYQNLRHCPIHTKCACYKSMV